MREAFISGAAMTPFGKFPDLGLRQLATDAATRALFDAGVEPSAVEMVFFGNAGAGILTGQEMIRGQAALRFSGLLGTPIVNVENACASSSSAAHLAWLAVASGHVDVALAVGAEKMTSDDKNRAFSALQAAVDLERLPELQARFDGGGSVFMDIYAENAKSYMQSSGATVADLAAVTVKSHRHAALNPNAQYRNPVTIDEVLASRTIAGPLTLLMCSPIGDGAAALVICSEDFARRRGGDGIRMRASALVSGTDDPRHGTASERAASKAYDLAGLGPQDLDVVELHDAAAPAELSIYEELGLCAAGDGPKLLAAGETTLGGRVPVNTSGGLISRGHPVGATGCAQLVELTDQLRGRCGDRQVDGARVALAENGGGYLDPDAAACVVTILSRD